MSAKDVLSNPNQARGAGTPIAEYSEQGPFHCDDCVWVAQRDVPRRGKGLCKEKHVLRDPRIPAAPDSKLKIIDLVHGCCRFVKYPKGYVEKGEEEDK